jgi:hypothetical protein
MQISVVALQRGAFSWAIWSPYQSPTILPRASKKLALSVDKRGTNYSLDRRPGEGPAVGSGLPQWVISRPSSPCGKIGYRV